ncbi:hypothetical protein HDU97_007731 [Phlyctochytrium planicorne]|nr:hypothetical protein HDU97_007731 [Phlyctochytrium planicorne]
MIAPLALLALSFTLPIAHALNPYSLYPRDQVEPDDSLTDYNCLDGASTCGPLSPQGFGTLAVCINGKFLQTNVCNLGLENACRIVSGKPACVLGSGVGGLWMARDSEAFGGVVGDVVGEVPVVGPGAGTGSGVVVGRRSAAARVYKRGTTTKKKKPKKTAVPKPNNNGGGGGGGGGDSNTAYGRQGLNWCQYDIILKITSTFETGSQQLGFDNCGNWNDGQGISAGFIQFTTSSGAALAVVQTYLSVTSRSNPPIASFLGALQRAKQAGNGGRVSGQGFMDGLWGFCDAWQEAARNDAEAFQNAQMTNQARDYLEPNRPIVQQYGLKTALAVGLMMDTGIQLGLDAVQTIAANSDGGNESDFIGSFLDAKARYLRKLGGAYAGTLYRVDSYRHILYSGNLNFVGNKVEALNNDGAPMMVSCN